MDGGGANGDFSVPVLALSVEGDPSEGGGGGGRPVAVDVAFGRSLLLG